MTLFRLSQVWLRTFLVCVTLQLTACGGGSSDAGDTDGPIETPADPTPEAPVTDPATEQPVNDPPQQPAPEPAPESDPGAEADPPADPAPADDESALPEYTLYFDDVDPSLLPLTLQPLEPTFSIPAGVSGDNEPPYFTDLQDTIVYAGQELNLVLAPKDSSGRVPGLFTSALPPASEYIDNFNGTRTIRWRPLQPDVGVTTVTVTAVDPDVPLLRTHQSIRIQVLMPDDASTIPNYPPTINGIQESIVRAGDTVIMHIRSS